MEVNSHKFQCIVFGKVVNPGTFLINGNIVRPETGQKLLGVHIDNKLNFGHHVSHTRVVPHVARRDTPNNA